MNSDLVHKVVCLAKKKITDFLENDDCSDEKEQIFYYTAGDFLGQDYEKDQNITTGRFAVPITDGQGKTVGQASWDSAGHPTNTKKGQLWSIHESFTISIGPDHNSTTFSGSAQTRCIDGFYDEGVENKFTVFGREGKRSVTITNIGDRENKMTSRSTQSTRQVVFK